MLRFGLFGGLRTAAASFIVALLLLLAAAGPSSPAPGAPLSPPQWIGLYGLEGKVGLKWIHSKDFSAMKIFRRPTAGDTGFTFLAQVREGQFIDEEVVAGTEYTYRLVALAADGRESPPSAERRVRVKAVAKDVLTPPQWEGYLFTDSGVGLKWQRAAVGEVLAYNVYRSRAPDGAYRLIGSTPETKFHDENVRPGETYRYVLTALNSSFMESGRSPELSVLLPVPEATPEKGEEIKWRARRTRLLKIVTGGKEPFFRPADVALSPRSGLVYVSDSGTGRIQVFTPEGAFLYTLGDREEDGRLFGNLLGLTVDRSGRIYGVDAEAGAILVLNEEGKIQWRIDLTKYFVDTTTGFIDAAVGADGKVFVVDNFNNRVSILGAAGLVHTFGGQGNQPGAFSAPTFCDMDKEGFLHVSDALNGRVQVFDSSGSFVRSFGRYRQGPGGLGRPKGVAVSGRDEIFVADSWQNMIQVFDGEGRLLAILTDEQKRPLDLGSPNGIALGDGNRIYIVERLTNRLQIREFIDGP